MAATSTSFELRLGALTDKLSAQLRAQKLKFDRKVVRMYEGHLLAIVRLSVHGLITTQEKAKCFQRLVKKVQRHVQEYN